MNLIFINSHPIQYFAPMYQSLAKEKDWNLRVIYLSSETVGGYMDTQFGVKVAWDIPLLEGYDYSFLKNHSWKPSFNNGFFGLINFGIVSELWRAKTGSIIVVHGWAHFSNVMSIYVARLFGHTVCMRGESPMKQESAGLRSILKMFFFKILLFPFINKFLYIGEQNRLFYAHFGVKDSDLIFTPYCVDNDRFREDYNKLSPHRYQIREELKIGKNRSVFLYSGKYIEKKRPLDLVKAVSELNDKDVFLILMGEGEMRSVLTNYIENNGLADQVLMTGFVNQTEISRYYAIADVFVMCSGKGETWGLAVNEAMNFNLPLIVSDSTGCSDDLVNPDENGYIFKTGDIEGLKKMMRIFLDKNKIERFHMGEVSSKIVSKYSYTEIKNILKKSLL